MSNENSVKYYKRGFLNKGEGMAAFEANVEFEDWEDYIGCVTAHFSITDCNRKVCLDFCAHDQQAYEDSMNKINILIEELANLQSNLLGAWKKHEVHKAIVEAKEKDET
jgi:hypothetical protein